MINENKKLRVIKTDWKDKVQYTTAVLSFLAGAGMGFLSFLTKGTIESTVLGFIAECLMLTAGIFGVTMYIRTKFGELRSYVIEKIENDRHDIDVVKESNNQEEYR